ncbi:hypothetical protein F5146DRAFT_1120441 [Armillaria mellea]|nr:hypothetical protein F5146DRAFT_1120441 [Armillaria mellea]
MASSPLEKIWLKVFIVVLFTLDILNSVFTIMWVYKLLIDNFGNFAVFAKSDWTVMSDSLLAGIMAGMVQVFFTWKIWILTKNYFYVSVIVICALTSSAGGIATSALGDLVITVVITISLQRAKGSIRRTNPSELAVTMQNGKFHTLPSLRQVFNLGVAFILPKLYTNSALSSLNARQPHTHDVGDEVNSLAMPWDSSGGPPRSQGVLISVEYESHEMTNPHNQKNASMTISDD